MEAHIEEKTKAKRFIYQSKKKVNEQFERKMNDDVNSNRKLHWKEVSKAKGRKVESCSRIKGVNRRVVQGEDEMQKIWKDYYEHQYNINAQEPVGFHICGFDGIRRGNYFGGELISRKEVEVRVGKLKIGKAAYKVKITGEMIKGGSGMDFWDRTLVL